MKNLLYFVLLLGFIFPTSIYAQEKVISKEKIRAKEGEKVFLVINYVKNEAKEDYLKFMEDIFFDVVINSKSPIIQEQHSKTRWLHPQGQNNDQSWTYVYLMDPLVENGNYQFETVLQEKYDKEEVEALMKQFNTYLAAPANFHPLIQSKY